MVLEEVRVLHLIPKTDRRRLFSSRQLARGYQSSTLQGSTSSNQATLPNRTAPWAKHVQITTDRLNIDMAVWGEYEIGEF